MEGFDVFFSIISIIFFSQSLTADKKFMQTKDPNLYPAVKSKGNAAKVFFIFSCIRFVVGIVSICGIMGVFSMGADLFFEDRGALISLFAVSLISNVITFTIGVMSVMKYKEAQKLYSTLTPKPSAVNGGFNAVPYGNGANNNGTNYANPNNTGANYNNSNMQSAANAQSSYQNLHTNDPAQLRSSTGDQSPFEAPPPNYTRYNYGNTGGYQKGITIPIPHNDPQNNNPQNIRQNTSVQPVNRTEGYNPPPVNNSANVNKTEPKQYVSQMPEVTPFSASNPSTASSATQNAAAAPQKPVVPVVVPAPAEIKRETTVRCKHCGVTNKEGDKFCTFCGKSLSE